MNICKAPLKCKSEVGAILSSIKFTSLQLSEGVNMAHKQQL